MCDTRKRPRGLLLAALGILSFAGSNVGAQDAANENRAVTIEYIAHACFRVTSPSGKQVLIDPYASRVWLGYDFPPGVRADAVLISHPHYDHDGGEAMGRPVPWAPNTPVLRAPGTNQIGDIAVVGYAGKHADPWGKEFGQSNTIWLVRVAGLRIVHPGDNGPLREDTIEKVGRVDVLMMPIDSQFHILKADQIADIRGRLFPPILIPMHYRHEDLETNPNRPEQLGGIDDWAKEEANVRYLTANKLDVSFASLPKKPEVLIFKHSPLVKPPSNISEYGKENPEQVVGGALDLIGPAVAFRDSHQRWPKNYMELSPLVEQSVGKAQARKYDKVELTELPDGNLEIHSVVQGQTNRIILPVNQPNRK
jgi:L-ascorbate metabolism protein UlaG (beta-lactamase superfamily)